MLLVSGSFSVDGGSLEADSWLGVSKRCGSRRASSSSSISMRKLSSMTFMGTDIVDVVHYEK